MEEQTGQLREGEIVFRNGRDSGPALKGFLARPAGKGPYPGLIVLHEIFGVNEQMRAETRRLARAGYAALAVDLFSGGPLCVYKSVRDMMNPSSDNESTRALQAALDHLAAMRFVDPLRLGALGFCMGGNFAIALARQDRRLKVIAPFYGFLPPSVRSFESFCPVVGSYPGLDYTAIDANKLARGLRAAEVSHDVKVYPGTVHSFTNERMPLAYNAEASRDAWDRTLRFFAEHL